MLLIGATLTRNISLLVNWQHLDHWDSLLPPNFTALNVDLVYRRDFRKLHLFDIQFAFPELAQLLIEQLLTVIKFKLRCKERPIVELRTPLL